jgi:hypothetical protein
MDDDGDDINLHCIQAGLASTLRCGFSRAYAQRAKEPCSVWLRAGLRAVLGQLVPDGMSRLGIEIRFHDLSGLAKYPVDAPQLPDSHVVVRVYRAQDHFTRQLIIPEIRLSDWGQSSTVR